FCDNTSQDKKKPLYLASKQDFWRHRCLNGLQNTLLSMMMPPLESFLPPVTLFRALGSPFHRKRPRKANIRASLYETILLSGTTVSIPFPTLSPMHSTRKVLNAPPPVINSREPDVPR